MPNWKKVVVSGSDAALNSLLVTGGITGSLLGTASTASYVDLVAGPNITINQVGTSFEITGSGGGGGDTNFANTDLTFTGNRSHDLSGNSLSLLNGSSIILSGSGALNNILLKHDANQVYVQSARTSFNPVNADINFQVGTVGTDYALNVDGGTDRVSINKNLPNATLDVNGDTIISGSLNVTASFTASGLNYPDTDGVDRQVIKTDGLGNLTFGYPEEIIAIVKNVSGGTLLKGTPVHATESGAMGNVVGIIPASASVATSMPATFVLNETLADEAEGEALASGFIQGVNTSGFEVGQIVYVGESGGYTNVKPTGSNLIQNLGIVTKVDATNGSGYVLGAGRSNDVPNILEGYAWIGNSDGVAIPTPTSSIQNVISSSFASTASYVNPLVQDVIISGSLIITGSNTNLNSSITTKTTRVTGSAYTILNTDYRIGVRYSLTGSCTLQLPNANKGELDIRIKDEEGNADTNNIIVSASAGDLIDGSTAVILDRNYIAISLYNDGTSNWYIE